MIYLIYKWNDC